MLGLIEIIDQLAIVNCVPWFDQVLRRALCFEDEGQRKKERCNRPWKNRLRKKV